MRVIAIGVECCLSPGLKESVDTLEAGPKNSSPMLHLLEISFQGRHESAGLVVHILKPDGISGRKFGGGGRRRRRGKGGK